jgi:DNA-nicking Smr family endonuclease
MRRLSVEERAVWARVTGTVKPVAGQRSAASLPRFVHDEPAQAPPSPVAAAIRKSNPAISAARAAVSRRDAQNTLDGSWDKRLRLGQAAPDVTIDLHGETLSSAHARLNRSIAAAVRSDARIILLITGRPAQDNPRLPPSNRGVIRASVGDWLAASPHAANIAAVRNAHPRHGGAGALYLILRRAR